MAVFNEPTKWQTSLVNSGDANVIPQSTPVGTGEASFDDGFPQITQIPIGAGGIAPDRKDFNGLFKILGDWIFFNQNGGVSTYSENFDYVAGRVVSYNGNIYKCIQANGVSSTVVAPDSDTAYWQRIDNFVRSVNGVDADAQGNVTIDINKFMPDYLSAVAYPITLTEQELVIPYDCLLNFDSAGFDNNYCTLYIDNTLIIKRTTNSDQYVMSCNYSGYVKKGSIVKYKSGYANTYASTNLLTLFILN